MLLLSSLSLTHARAEPHRRRHRRSTPVARSRTTTWWFLPRRSPRRQGPRSSPSLRWSKSERLHSIRRTGLTNLSTGTSMLAPKVLKLTEYRKNRFGSKLLGMIKTEIEFLHLCSCPYLSILLLLIHRILVHPRWAGHPRAGLRDSLGPDWKWAGRRA